MLWIVLYMIVLMCSMYKLNRYVQRKMLSPLYFLVGLCTTFCVLGYFFYDPAYGGTGGKLTASDEDMTLGLQQVLASMIAAVFGGLIYFWKKRRNVSYEDDSSINFGSRLIQWGAIGMFAVGIFLAFYSITPAAIWRAHEYLPQTLSSLAEKSRHIAAMLFIPMFEMSALFSGILSVQKGAPRKISIVMICAIFLLFLSQASRVCVVSMFLFLIGRLIASEDYQIKKRVMAMVVVIAVLSSQIVIDLRNAPELGLVGLAKYLVGENESQVAEKYNDSTFGLIRTLNNVDCSLVIQTYSAKPFSGEGSVDYLLLSINPMLGSMVGWYDREERINIYTPYSALGEIWRCSFWFALPYMFFLGWLMTKCHQDLLNRRAKFTVIIRWLLCFLPCIYIQQYNLRTVTRFIYYILLILIFEALQNTVSTNYRYRSGRKRQKNLPPVTPTVNAQV